MNYIYNYKKFNEVRLSSVLNVIKSNDENLFNEINNRRNLDFNIDKSLVKNFTSKKYYNKKKINLDINWYDTAKHEISKRLKGRTSFQSISEFNQMIKDIFNYIFPDKIKEIEKDGKYSIYIRDMNISIIIVKKNISLNNYKIIVLTIIPGYCIDRKDLTNEIIYEN